MSIRKKVSVDPSARLSPGVYVGAGSVIGPDTVVRIGVTIGEDVAIGRGVTVDRFASIREKSVIGDRCVIDANAYLFPKTTLADGVQIGRWAKVSGSWLISPFYKQMSDDLMYATSPGGSPMQVVIMIGDMSRPLEDWLPLGYRELKAKLLDTWSPAMVREVHETLHEEVLPWARAAGERGEL
jgi:NDP-sugar pyrophosphorylase family protein